MDEEISKRSYVLMTLKEGKDDDYGACLFLHKYTLEIQDLCTVHQSARTPDQTNKKTNERKKQFWTKKYQNTALC